jgi:WD40 repeat protein/serine/threonine protein kinase
VSAAARPPEHETLLDEFIATYLEMEEAGQTLVPEEFLIEHPALREPFARFLAGYRRLNQISVPLREIVAPLRAGEEQHATQAALPRLFGAYRLTEEIGRGGMGVVYRAEQQVAKRLVALKVLRFDPLVTTAEIQRFRNEAELIAHLDHPGIVPIHEVGCCEGQWFYSMKLMEGGNLAGRLAELRGDPKKTARLLASIARAVHHAHQRGILHRDLKPSNILLDDQGRPYVTDFGLAKRLPETEGADTHPTQPGLLVGTPAYMAPEQAVPSPSGVTTATDVYGLGATLYFLLTGRPPHQGMTPLDTLMLVARGDSPTPRTLAPDVEPDLETICLKCLAREPARRYASAEALADDLQRWLDGKPILARPTTRFERFVLWSRRNPAFAALTLLASFLALALVIGLAVGVYLLSKEQAEVRSQKTKADEQKTLALERAEALRRLLYAADIQQAGHAFHYSDVMRMRELLDRQVPGADQEDLRGFEWYYLRHLLQTRDSARALRHLHGSEIFGLAVAPGDKTYATASRDRTAVVWDAVTGQRLFTLPGFANDVNSVAFTRDGRTLIAAGEDGAIITCDARTGEHGWMLSRCSLAVPPVEMAGALTGSGLAGAISAVLPILTGSAIPVLHVELSPDQKLLAAGRADGAVLLMDFPSARQRLAARVHSRTRSVAFSADGTLLSAGEEGHIHRWDVRSLKVAQTFGPGHFGLRAMAVARSRPLAAIAHNDSVGRIWDYQTGKEVHALRGHKYGLIAIAISPDDRLVASSDRSGAVRIWDLASGRLVDLLPGAGQPAWSIAFTPDSKALLAAESNDVEGAVRRWELTIPTYRRLLHTHTGLCRAFSFRPGDSALAALYGHEDLVLLDPGTGHARQTISLRGPARCFAISHDGKTLASGHEDGRVRLWDFADQRLLKTIQAHPGPVIRVGFDRDNKVLTASVFEPIKVWEPASGELLGSVHSERSTGHFALSPDGQKCAATTLKDILVIDMATRKVERTLPADAADLVFSADGSHLAAARGNYAIQLWDLRNTEQGKVLRGHTEPVLGLAFAPDGKTLASAAADGSVRLWHVATGQEMLALPASAANYTVAFSANGHSLVAGGHGSRGGEVFGWSAPRD